MKLLKFRIRNYKSIVDSGDCYFSEKLTILAGKNESGKTTILEALEDFHEDREIRKEAQTIGSKLRPEVIVTFRLTKGEVNEIYTDAELSNPGVKELDLELYKTDGSKAHYLTAGARKILGWESLYSATIDKIKKLTTTTPKPKYTNQTPATYKTELQTFLSALGLENEDHQKVTEVIEAISTHLEREDMVRKFVKAFVANKLPYFILFSSFEDSFPDEMSVAELSDNDWATDLSAVSSFDKTTIASSNRQTQHNHQSTVNTEFTDKFNRFWTQDEIKLQVAKDGDTICFWIDEDGTSYKPSQRSQGQQWYLSFFIRIVARISEDKPNVILIDEPGLFLHARAQKDLLQVLNDHTSNYPIVFSTHSPYLITEDNLENIRLVEKSSRKTTILGKVHAHKTADKETLTPILTAIGLGVNDSITNLDQKDNIIVEGPEDVFYLQAFKETLPKSDRPNVNFINGGGAGKMGAVGAILEGWGANVYYLFDNDQGGKDGGKHLAADWKVLPECIKVATKDDSSTIADVLSAADFKKFVLENETLTSKLKNSTYITKNGLEKVLLARQFLQKVKASPIKLDGTSAKNIKALFEEIKF